MKRTVPVDCNHRMAHPGRTHEWRLRHLCAWHSLRISQPPAHNKDGVGHAPALRQQWTCPPAAGSGHGAERQCCQSNALGEDAEALPSRVQCGPFAESRKSLVPPSTHAALRRSSHTSLNACNGRTSKVRLQRAVLRDEVLCSISAVSQAGRCAALRAPRRAHLPEVVPAEQHELILTDAHH